MALQVDKMAQRYGKLPSEVLQNGLTTDLKIMDIVDSYIHYQRTIQETGLPPAPKATEDQLLAAIKAAKEHKKKRKSK